MKNITLALLMSGALVGCANIGDLSQAEDYKQYEEITKQYNVKEKWWSLE